MSESTCIEGGFEALPPWVSVGGFILSIMALIVIFWAFSFICEEYCIPSMTILCKKNKISDDVAGAIFIGAGLSSPPLFTALIGLFLSNSSIGVGTVVGGDIFNHLLNMSATIIAAPNHTLQLDGMGLTREALFYMASLIVIIWSTKGNIFPAIVDTFDTRTWKDCLQITWLQSLIPVLLYGVYCLNVIYLPGILNKIFPQAIRPASSSEVAINEEVLGEEEFAPSSLHYDTHTSIDDVRVSYEETYVDPFSNGDVEGYIRLNPSSLPIGTSPTALVEMIQQERNGSLPYPDHEEQSEMDVLPENEADEAPLHRFEAAMAVPSSASASSYPYTKESKALNGVNIEDSDFILCKRSDFYTIYDFGCVPRSRQWKERYFTANVYGLYYRVSADQERVGQHIRFINLFEAAAVEVIDHSTLEFHIRMRSKRKRYKFQALDLETFEKVVLFVNMFIMSLSNKSDEERRALASAAILAVSGGTGVVSSPDIESADEQMFVIPSSRAKKVIYYLTLPWRYLMFFTIPDVRKPKYQSMCVLSIWMSIVWLFGYSYLLIVSLNVLSSVLKINGAIMGYTIGAWTASYPALWSSVVLAKHGYGDMASCNALGSNTFTNFIGLGLPWLLYSIVHGGRTYDKVSDGGAVLSLLLLWIVLIAYYALLAFTRWKLYGWYASVCYLSFSSDDLIMML
jgi:Ca2+/Na+ antiporter